MHKPERVHQIAYHHVRRHVRRHVKKHKKRYIRFMIFFIVLLIVDTAEHLTAASLAGTEFDAIFLVIIIITAILFTSIAEITEVIVEREKPKIEKIIKKEEKAIETEEKIIKRKLKKRF